MVVRKQRNKAAAHTAPRQRRRGRRCVEIPERRFSLLIQSWLGWGVLRNARSEKKIHGGEYYHN